MPLRDRQAGSSSRAAHPSRTRTPISGTPSPEARRAASTCVALSFPHVARAAVHASLAVRHRHVQGPLRLLGMVQRELRHEQRPRPGAHPEDRRPARAHDLRGAVPARERSILRVRSVSVESGIRCLTNAWALIGRRRRKRSRPPESRWRRCSSLRYSDRRRRRR